MTARYVYALYMSPRMPKWIQKRVAQVRKYLDSSDYLARYMPQWLHIRVARGSELLHIRYFLWRIGHSPTRLIGPVWRRQIDITYSCNLKCFNCNRSCAQDPSNDHMSVAQVRQFLEESRAAGNPWKRISVLGGEPTNHPQFVEIMDLIVGYRDKYSASTPVQLFTNGHGERVGRMLSHVPPGVQIFNTSKTTKVQTKFRSFNVAPIDLKEYAAADFANGCFATRMCGLGVTPYGYYPCAIAGAIDRTFGFNLGRIALPKANDSMKQELRRFCALCGFFKLPTGQALLGPLMSPAWVEAYARSHQNPPTLSRLPEHGRLVQVST